MTDTLLPTEDHALAAADGPGVPLPGLPGFHPVDPTPPPRSTPWALIVGLVLTTLLIAGVVGGVLLIGAQGASAAGGCGGG
jgi:hypothetical protein